MSDYGQEKEDNFYQELNLILDLLLESANPLTAYSVILKVLMRRYEAERCLIIRQEDGADRVVVSSNKELGKEQYSKTILSDAAQVDYKLLISGKGQVTLPGESLDRREITAMVVPLKDENEEFGCLYLDRHEPPYMRREHEELILFSKKLVRLLSWQDFYQQKHGPEKMKWGLFCGESEEMRSLYRQLHTAARTRIHCMIIEGESGTGKELAVRAIHKLSRRSDKQLLILNCAQLNGSEFGLSPIFGANLREKDPGISVELDGGVLVLDEVSALDMNIQAKLLRLIENQTSIAGKTCLRERQNDILFIVTTNQELWRLVKAGKFRNDLYQRLNILKITMPPLRMHKEDIMPIAWQILKDINRQQGYFLAGFSQEMKQYLQQNDWKNGNVRELQNFLQKQAVRQNGRGLLQINSDLNVQTNIPEMMPGQSLGDYLDNIKWLRIKETWKACGKNKTKTAAKLGLHKKQLYRYLHKYEEEHHKELLI